MPQTGKKATNWKHASNWKNYNNNKTGKMPQTWKMPQTGNMPQNAKNDTNLKKILLSRILPQSGKITKSGIHDSELPSKLSDSHVFESPSRESFFLYIWVPMLTHPKMGTWKCSGK